MKFNYVEAMTYLGRMKEPYVLMLARDRVPSELAIPLDDRGLAYWDIGHDRWRMTYRGAEMVAHVLKVRNLVGTGARRAVVTDDERRERNVRRLADAKDNRRKWLATKAKARTGAVLEEAKKMAALMTRGLEETECVSCGCEIEYKWLRIFDRKKKYECTVCGVMTRAKKVPRQPKAGQLPVISISGGLGAIVCEDCLEYCTSCWTNNTYKHIMKVYGVDLRD